MNQTVRKAINRQINMELSASYSYLAMSAYCQSKNFPGFARWLRIQSVEEYGHAMRLFDFLLDRGVPVELQAIAQPSGKFSSVGSVFETALEQEIDVSKQIDGLYELAFKEKAFAALAQLNWFLTEQVEEEKTAREIVAKLELIGKDPASLLDLDRDLGARAGTGGKKGDE